MSAKVFADLSELQTFLKEWDQEWHPKALRRALTGETFRVFKYTQALLNEGEMAPELSPLTIGLKRGKTRAPLGSFANMIGYFVEGSETAYIGFAVGYKRRKRVPMGWVKMLVGSAAEQVVITRADQKEIAGKLRKRKRVSLTRDDFRKYIPHVGRKIMFPPRPVIDRAMFDNAPYFSRNIARLYQMAIAGKKWRKDWWVPQQPELNLLGEG